jgi:hypothetical protein
MSEERKDQDDNDAEKRRREKRFMWEPGDVEIIYATGKKGNEKEAKSEKQPGSSPQDKPRTLFEAED